MRPYSRRVDHDATHPAIAALLARGRAAWPDVRIAEAIVVAFFVDKAAGNEWSRVDTLHGEDLYLAAACAFGEPTALAAFEARYLRKVPAFLARMRPAQTIVEEVQQQLRVRLLVASDAHAVPRIAEYGGRGTLDSWLRVAAVRLAIDLLRQSDVVLDPGSEVDERAPLLDQLRGDDIELHLLREQHRAAVNQALRVGFESLTAEQRNLLRLNYRDGRSIDEIGALLRAHRATVARWIAAAREQVLIETRRELGRVLAIPDGDLDSVIRALGSQLHLSMSRVLAG